MRSRFPLFVFLPGIAAVMILCGCPGCRSPEKKTAGKDAPDDPVISIISPALPDFDLARHEYARVLRLAGAALDAGPKTIVAIRNPRSAGGAHDFSSEGDYWWPNPNDPDGRYIQRDGMSNPDNFAPHRRLLMEFSRNVSALAAAFKLTRQERYGAAAAAHLRAWFIDPETRMNPSLEYAQAIKGLHTGRGIGVIDTLHLAEVAMAVVALRGAGVGKPDNAVAFTPETDAAVTEWFCAYLHWLRTHKYGIDESNAKNNHGTCWTLQAACFARVTGDEAALAECRERLTKIHIPDQMAADGGFPQELRRTKPYGYSIFNLDVMCALAQVLSIPDAPDAADTPGVAGGVRRHPSGLLEVVTAPGKNYMTWQISERDARGMTKAVGYLAPYLADKTKWPLKPDVMHWNDWPVRQPALLFGAMAGGGKDWLALWKTLDPDCMVEEVQRNFPIRQPVLWYQAVPSK